MNVIAALEKMVKENPDKPAIIFRDEAINFRQLRDAVFKLTNGLADLGLKRGDKVAIYLPNWPEYVYSYLAAWCLGLVAVPLDFMLTEDEVVAILTHGEAKILIAKEKANFSLAGLKQKCPHLQQVITFQEELTVKPECPKVMAQDKDYAIIFYTSGTTGRPKGVLINYQQLDAPPKSMQFFVGGIKPDDIALCALPFSHLGGLIYIQNCISYGMTFVLMERFIPLEFLKYVQHYKVTCFWIVPSMYYAFLQLKEFETFDLSSLRWIVTFGASGSPESLRRFHQYCPEAQLLNGWGLTETNAPTTVLPMGSDKIESVGRPAPWIEVKIFDEDKEMPQGKVGEVAVKGWVITDGYYKDPQATASAIRNGWFHTGDLGRFDNEGHLYIVGRIKEMIKVAGEIVFEPEVEAAIHKHPDVGEVAVIGVADELRGEVPKAFVVLKEEKNLTEVNLRYFLREHLAHFKIPHYFEFVPSLPKNRAGKIDKEQLRR